MYFIYKPIMQYYGVCSYFSCQRNNNKMLFIDYTEKKNLMISTSIVCVNYNIITVYEKNVYFNWNYCGL